MANPAAPTTTSLAAAMTRTQKSVSLASGTGAAVGGYAIIGGEACLIQQLVNASGTSLLVERGQLGTAATPHASGGPVYVGSASTFSTSKGVPYVPGDLDDPLPSQFRLPLGQRLVDPNTGYEYVAVDCQQATTAGQWVVFDQLGLATTITLTSAGPVGIVAQTVGSSDTLALALVVGKYSGAAASSILSSEPPPAWLAPSSVTAGAVKTMLAGAGSSSVSNAPGANIIWGAIYLAETTSAVSSGTIPGVDVYLNNPYCQGLGLIAS